MKSVKSETSSKQGRAEVHPALLQYFVDASFEVLTTGLYIGITLDTESTLHTKAMLLRYYKRIAPEQFKEKIPMQLAALCKKVSLYRDMAISQVGTYIPHPCIWVQRVMLQQKPEECSCGNCTCGKESDEEYKHDELLFKEMYGSIQFFLTPVKY